MASDVQEFEVVVIGAGPGGYTAAIRLAQRGLNVALIEQEALGGTCLNWGCIPSKALIYAGEQVHRLKTSEAMGLHVSGVSLDLAQLQTWKQTIVNRLKGGVKQLLAKHKVTVITGQARFLDSKRLEVFGPQQNHQIQASRAVVIATGSVPATISSLPLNGKTIVDARDVLNWQALPERLTIVGGGVIGLEMACMLKNLGVAHLQILEGTQTLLPGFDPDLQAFIAQQLKHAGILIETGVNVQTAQVMSDSEVKIIAITSTGETQHYDANAVLVATGRKPNSGALGLKAIGVALDARGAITIDAAGQTNVAGVYAIGDVTGGPMLAHRASQMALATCGHINQEPGSAFAPVAIPSAVFCSPEVASVGLSEPDAVKQFGTEQVKTGVFPLVALGRAHAMRPDLTPPPGFVKIVSHGPTDRLLGVHIAGEHMAELLGEATLALEAGLTVQDVSLTVHAHPTLSEGLMEAAEAVHRQAIHYYSA